MSILKAYVGTLVVLAACGVAGYAVTVYEKYKANKPK